MFHDSFNSPEREIVPLSRPMFSFGGGSRTMNEYIIKYSETRDLPVDAVVAL